MAYTGTSVKDLNETKPNGAVEAINIGDDAIREVKKVIKNQHAITEFTGADTLDDTHSVALCDATSAGFTIALPLASTVANSSYRKEYTIKKTDSSANIVTIGGTVDGVVNPQLTAQYQSMTVYTDGTSWFEKRAGDAFTVGGYSASDLLNSNLIPTGTKMAFFQAAAPTGWTQDTTHNDKALRVVSGSGGGNGGTYGFSSASVGSTTLSEAQMPSHAHTIGMNYVDGSIRSLAKTNVQNGSVTNYQTSSSSGSSTAHNHALALHYIDVIVCSKN